MLTLIVALLFGLLIALFAMQNTAGATITIAQYRFTQVPLYIVVIGSLFFGILISWFISILDGISSFFVSRGEKRSLRQANKTIATLEERLHNLEKENVSLKEHEYISGGDDEADEQNISPVHKPNIFQRFKYFANAF
jgi:uncharacterized integral membrane protein